MLNEKGLQNVLDHQFGGRKESSPGSCESVSVTRVMMLMAVLAVIAGCGENKFSNYSRVEREEPSKTADVVKGVDAGRAEKPIGFTGNGKGGNSPAKSDAGKSLKGLLEKKLPAVFGGGTGPDPDSPDSVDPLKVQKVFELSRKLAKGMNEEDLWKKTVELGASRRRLVRYEGTGLSEIITPQEYYDLVSSLVESPEDVRKVLIGLIEYEKDLDNVLPSAVTVLSRGFGDCDQQSNLAKELLRDLGRKGGRDYSPRVISLNRAEHAVCIFTGEDGLHSIDQEGEILSFDNVAGASNYYKEFEGKEFDVSELSLGKGGVRIAVKLDPATLEVMVDRGMIVSFFNGKNVRDTDFVDYFPDGWEKFKKIDVVVHGGGGRLGYKDGQLDYIKLPDGVSEFYDESGKLVQKTLPDGTILGYDANDGFLRFKKLTGIGYTEFYNKAGVIVQKNYQSGRIESFSEDGGWLKQVNHPDGLIEVFNSQGKVVRREQGVVKEPVVAK